MKKVEIHSGLAILINGLLLNLFLLLSLNASSQKGSTTDSVTISKRAAQNILIAADSLDRSKLENVLLKKEIGYYKSLVGVKDGLIKNKQDSIGALLGIRSMQEEQKQLLLTQISLEKKKVRRQKFKTTVSQIALLLVTGVLITKL